MNWTEKRVMKIYKTNADRVKEDLGSIIELYKEAMEMIIEKGLYAELMRRLTGKAMEKIKQ